METLTRLGEAINEGDEIEESDLGDNRFCRRMT